VHHADYDTQRQVQMQNATLAKTLSLLICEHLKWYSQSFQSMAIEKILANSMLVQLRY